MQPDIAAHYANIRQQNEAERERRQRECAAKNARFAVLFAERAEISAQLARRKLSPPAAMGRLRRLKSDEELLLIQSGLPASYLGPIYSCPYCRDTGYAGDSLKKPCGCHLLLMQQYLAAGARINAEESFETFDENIYSDPAQKKTALNARQLAEHYAEELPRPTPPHLLIFGQPGLGKTFLGNAIAFRAISNGVSALYTTAGRFMAEVLEGIGERKSRTPLYTAPQLLVLDDVGTEAKVPGITNESLFFVLNERILDGKPTVVITNLSLAELLERYDERIGSRLCDRGSFRVFRLTGENLRLRGR